MIDGEDEASFPSCVRILGTILCLGLATPAHAEMLLGVPKNLGPEINSAGADITPTLSGDGKTLYFSSNRPGGHGVFSLWKVTRESIGGDWSAPVSIPEITGNMTVDPSVTADGLEMYFGEGYINFFSSARPGGEGSLDIWVSRRASVDDPWGEPENVGAVINSTSAEEGPNISPDGLTLTYASNRAGGPLDAYVATRESVDSPWSEPVVLKSINTASADWPGSLSPDGLTMFFDSTRPGSHQFGDIWMASRPSIDAEFGEPIHLAPLLNTPPAAWDLAMSPDGSSLFFTVGTDRDDIWEMPVLSFERAPLVDGSYRETFDRLGAETDGARGGTVLPTGWSVSDNGVIFQSATTRRFPAGRSTEAPTKIFNAGVPDEPDRALAIGGSDSRGATIQLLVDVSDNDVTAFQLGFDLEVWDAARRSDSPGRITFGVTLEADSGEGFVPLADLGLVTTGPLDIPEESFLNGNETTNRVSFDSGLKLVNIPPGSLRVRWTVPDDAETSGWVFGLDNVSLDLIAQPAVGVCEPNSQGDLDGNGTVEFADFLLLSTNFGSTAVSHAEGDVNCDGEVSFADFLALAENFGAAVAAETSLVPEPSMALLHVWPAVCLLHMARVPIRRVSTHYSSCPSEPRSRQ